MKKLISILVVTILILTGCKGEENNGKPNIVTTVFPVTEIVKVVAGEDANISSIYPSGADVHNYELTSKDMAKIADSDLFFYISESNEPFVHALEESGKYKTKFINISEHELFKNKVISEMFKKYNPLIKEDYVEKFKENTRVKLIRILKCINYLKNSVIF